MSVIIDFDAIAREAASDAVKRAVEKVIQQMFSSQYGTSNPAQEAVKKVTEHMLANDPELQQLIKDKLLAQLKK